MNMDFSRFKKVKEDDHSAVLEHPEGHHISIAKKALSPKMQKDLASLPMHLEGGGEVPDTQPKPQQDPMRMPTIVINNGPAPQQQPMQMAQAPEMVQQQAPVQQPDFFSNGTFDPQKYAMQSPDAPVASKIQAMQSMDQQQNAQAQQEMLMKQKAAAEALQYNELAQKRGLPPIQVPEGAAPQPQAAAPQAPVGIQPGGASTSQVQRPGDPYGTQAYYNAYSSGLNEQKAGLAGEAKALGAQGTAQAEMLGQNVQAQQERMKSYDEHYQELNQELKHFMSDYQQKHIDPKHYLNSMGTGQKVRTAIGLILGGMGGGLTHQENPAMKFLQSQIDLDVKAQSAEMDKSNNLMAANFKQFGNLRDATQMTQAMQMNIVSDQLKQEAAKAQDPLAKARALQAAGQLDQTAAPILSQMAMRKTLLGGASSGQVDPSSVVRMIVPEHHQPAAYKELGEAQESLKARDNALSVFDKLAKINTATGRMTSPLQTGKQVEAIRNPVLMELAKDAAGKYSEQEYHALKPLFPEPLDDDQTLAVKRAKLLSMVQKKMNTPLLTSYGINLGNVAPGGRYGNQGQKNIQLGPVVK